MEPHGLSCFFLPAAIEVNPKFWRKTSAEYFIPHEELKLNIRP